MLVMAFASHDVLAQPVLITSPVTIGPGDVSVTPSDGGPAVPLATADITVRGTTLTVNGRHTIRNLIVESNGTVTHAASFTHDYSGSAGTDVVNGMWLNVQANPGGGNVWIDATSRIDVTGKGYGSQQGPGYSSDTGLSSHGGRSIYNPCCHTPAPTYGSVRQPTELGSGAGTRGGGAVRLIVNGTLTIDGAIHADGVYDQYASSGSGGSVWITAGTITGEGAVSADSWWWSGGGRVSVESTSNEFAGEIQALGGANTPTNASGAGTVWISENGIGTLIIDNKGRVVSSNLPLTTTPITASGIVLSASDAVVVAAGAVMEVVDPILVGSLDVIDGGVVTHRPGHLLGARVTVDGHALIDATSRIDVTGKGFGSQQGPGYSSDTGLASHGGRSIYNPCCHTPAPTYGSVRQPTELGSGAGTRGGGAVRLIVNGTLTIDGEIHADGVYDQYASSGSGGSVWITAGTITGEGAVSADSWWWSGGGRVSVESTSNEFTGDIRALGGLASRTSTGSGAGTVWISEDGIGTLIIDNRGLAVPANVPLTTTPVDAGSLTLTTRDAVVVKGEGRMEVVEPITVGSLDVIEGGIVTHGPGHLLGARITVDGDALIDATSRIDVTSKGYAGNQGPGYSSDTGLASHGGRSIYNPCCHTPAPTYGSAQQPTDLGSGAAYPGGGAVRLAVGGTLALEGAIHADGHFDSYQAGGSGGSVWVTAGTFQGAGTISADAQYFSGGGRVSVECTSNEFTGQIQAIGTKIGTSNASAAGTVWISEDGIGTLIINNKGRIVSSSLPLTTTPISHSNVTLTDADTLIVHNQGIAELRDPISLWSVVVGDDGRIVSESGSSASVNITTVSDLIVDATATIDVAGRGYGPGSGPGYPWQDDTYNCAVFGSCCGSAHTLMGSCPDGHQSGASIYGSAMAPTTPGSGSGSGPGGGVVRLTVGGGLYVDGLIRADGVAGGNGIFGGSRADGGSGGSIWITASEFAGTGYVSTLGIGRSVGGPFALYACSMSFPISQILAGTEHFDTDGMLIISEPASASFCAGPDYAFTFGVLGATSFQWTREGVPLVDGPTGTGSVISGSETPTLTIVNATTADAGVYRATASSACGSLSSQPATLGTCPAEYNCDDGVDILDFLDFIDEFASCELLPAPCGIIGNADINGDTFVDILDFLDFVDSFGSGC